MGFLAVLEIVEVKLGQGSFGSVWRAKHRESGDTVRTPNVCECGTLHIDEGIPRFSIQVERPQSPDFTFLLKPLRFGGHTLLSALDKFSACDNPGCSEADGQSKYAKAWCHSAKDSEGRQGQRRLLAAAAG